MLNVLFFEQKSYVPPTPTYQKLILSIRFLHTQLSLSSSAAGFVFHHAITPRSRGAIDECDLCSVSLRHVRQWRRQEKDKRLHSGDKASLLWLCPPSSGWPPIASFMPPASPVSRSTPFPIQTLLSPIALSCFMHGAVNK